MYIHDGQSLYDVEITWNKQALNLDEIAGKLMSEKRTKQFILVGIWNNDQKRHEEYFLEKPYEGLTMEQKELVTTKLKEKGRNSEKFNPISD